MDSRDFWMGRELNPRIISFGLNLRIVSSELNPRIVSFVGFNVRTFPSERAWLPPAVIGSTPLLTPTSFHIHSNSPLRCSPCPSRSSSS